MTEDFVPLDDARPQDVTWAPASWPPDPDAVLRRGPVTLRAARREDAAALFAALDDDEVWAHVRGRPGDVAGMARFIDTAPTLGRWTWVVELDGVVVGTTSYLEVSALDARCEIGATLYARRVWSTKVNPSCKLLLLSWAFDVAGMGRVQLKTDVRNHRSQAAISRLGARLEGVLRRYQRRADDTVRDTVLFSITAEEWPAVRAGLEARLGQ